MGSEYDSEGFAPSSLFVSIWYCDACKAPHLERDVGGAASFPPGFVVSTKCGAMKQWTRLRANSVSPRQPTDEPVIPPRSHSVLHVLLQLLVPAAILLFIAVGMVTGYLEKWLWMGQLGYTGIFWTLFSVQWAMFAAAFVVVFLFMWINLRQALLNSGAVGGPPIRQAILSRTDAADRIDIDLSPKLMRSAIVIVSLLIAWFAADGFFSQWDTYLRFRYGGSFGVADPLYGIDVGFYVFHLPFYQLLQTSLMLLTIVAMAGAGSIYVLQALRASGTVSRTQHHVASVGSAFHPGCQLGFRALPRSL